MKLRFFLLVSLVMLCYGFVPSHAMKDWKDVFPEGGKQFQRNNSLIYLKWSAGSSEGEKSPGFHIHDSTTNTQIGSVGIQLDSKPEAVYLSSFSIDQDQEKHSTEVFMTLTGVFKARKSKIPKDIKYLSYVCERNNQKTIEAAKEAGFHETQLYPLNPSYVYLIKDIPNVVPSPRVTLDKAPLFSQSVVIAPHDENVFKVGASYQIDRYKDIYLQYDMIGISIAGESYGFKIFRAREQDDIGYFTFAYAPNCDPLLRCGYIYIQTILINKNMRCKGYASKSLETFIALCRSKKVHFSDAQYFSFRTMGANKAMFRVAEKVGFVNHTIKEMLEMAAFLGKSEDSQLRIARNFENGLMSGTEFRKSFKDEK